MVASLGHAQAPNDSCVGHKNRLIITTGNPMYEAYTEALTEARQAHQLVEQASVDFNRFQSALGSKGLDHEQGKIHYAEIKTALAEAEDNLRKSEKNAKRAKNTWNHLERSTTFCQGTNKTHIYIMSLRYDGKTQALITNSNEKRLAVHVINNNPTLSQETQVSYLNLRRSYQRSS